MTRTAVEMPAIIPPLSTFRSLLPSYKSFLQDFLSSSSPFRLLTTISPTKSPLPPKTLYVLDSSFNPPTVAHLGMAVSALTDEREEAANPKRLLLLLATHNADKGNKPASLEHRLMMMTILGYEIRTQVAERLRYRYDQQAEVDDVPFVDIGVTSHPYFHNKARAIDESSLYSSSPTQVHLTGYDTLIRLLSVKYYPPSLQLSVLDPFLSRHKIRVTYRTDDKWGSKDQQAEYLRVLAQGGRMSEGGRKEWSENIRLVDADMGIGVSSTKVRQACKERDEKQLAQLVPGRIKEWVLEQRLYEEH